MAVSPEFIRSIIYRNEWCAQFVNFCIDHQTLKLALPDRSATRSIIYMGVGTWKMDILL